MESKHPTEKAWLSCIANSAVAMLLILVTGFLFIADLFSAARRRLLSMIKSMLSLLFWGRKQRTLLVSLALLSVRCLAQVAGQAPASNTSPSAVNVLGQTLVSQDPTPVLFEDFGAPINTAKWTASAGGTGTSPTWTTDSAGTTLSAGGTLNGFSALTSVATFFPPEPGFDRIEVRAQLLSNSSVTTYNAWGLFNLPATPTIANPIVDGCGFDELQGTAKLSAICYQGTSGTTGTRVLIQDLSCSGTGNCAQPPDITAVHKYDFLFSGALAYWFIDGRVVASMPNGANGPNANTVHASAVSISNSGTANTLSLAAIVVGDTSRRQVTMCDPALTWQCTNVSASGGINVTTNLSTNAVVSNQQAVTGSAVALPSTVLTRPVCITVVPGGSQTVYLGPSGESTSTGFPLAVGATLCNISVANLNQVFVIASTTGSTVAWFAQ